MKTFAKLPLWYGICFVIILIIGGLIIKQEYKFKILISAEISSNFSYWSRYTNEQSQTSSVYLIILPGDHLIYREYPINTVDITFFSAMSTITSDGEIQVVPREGLRYEHIIINNYLLLTSVSQLPDGLKLTRQHLKIKLFKTFAAFVIIEILIFALVILQRKKKLFSKYAAQLTAQLKNSDSIIKLQNDYREFAATFKRRFGSGKIKVLFLIAFTLIILIIRKPGQFFYPYIWAEEGEAILASYLLNGFGGIFETVSGYHIFSSSLLSTLAFQIDFWHYPELAALFANLFILFIILAIAYSPTKLKAPFACAIMTLLVKTGSECFGVALYSFWWAGLLLVLVTLWQDDKKPVLRNFYLLLGGFSSPLICIATPLLVLSALFTRTKAAIITAIISLLPFIIQTYAIVGVPSLGKDNKTGIFSLDMWFGSIKNLVGSYIAPSTNNFMFLGFTSVLLLCVLVICGLNWRKHKLKAFITSNLPYIILCFWLIGNVMLSAVRYADIYDFDLPMLMRWARYYFYPFIILNWMTIWVIKTLANRVFNVAVKIVLALVMLNFLYNGFAPEMIMEYETLNWREQLTIALQTKGEDAYPLRVYYVGGHFPSRWLLHFTADEYQYLLDRSWFGPRME